MTDLEVVLVSVLAVVLVLTGRRLRRESLKRRRMRNADRRGVIPIAKIPINETPYVDQMDLIFIDRSHAYSYVISDSRKALRMIRSGGLVLWHDYDGPLAGRGTDEALVELARELPLRHIEQTRMVVYRAP